LKVVSTIAEARAARAALGPLGLVPTMGYLHDGHLSLVAQAKAGGGAVAATIFVNPTQFGPTEDLSRYPRDLERDLRLLEAAGVDLVFTPTPEVMYPQGFDARIDVGAITEKLEGAIRPGHFAGVCTVVAKLFNILQPDRAYFGQKDAQQCAVIRRMVADLDVPVEILIGETVREADGLALSSRNVYLSPEQRAAAAALYQALLAARGAYAGGERRAEALRDAAKAKLSGAVIDYVSVADRVTLDELELVTDGALVSLAVRFGATRLIDNLILS